MYLTEPAKVLCKNSGIMYIDRLMHSFMVGLNKDYYDRDSFFEF